MVDASIIVAIIALAGSTIAIVISSWSAYSMEKRKSIREAEKLLHKYQDPLLLAARDLQTRLYNILILDILSFAHGTENQQDALFIYTTYLVGQYFAWIHILQRQGQFITFASRGQWVSRTQAFVRITNAITSLLNTGFLHETTSGMDVKQWETRWWWKRRGRGDEPRDVEQGHTSRWTMAGWWAGRRQVDKQQNPKIGNTKQRGPESADIESQNAQQPDAAPQDAVPQDADPQDADPQDAEPQDVDLLSSFVLWKDCQRAIGEIMTETDKRTGEMICMEYSEFRRRWKDNDSTLHTWLRVIPEAIQYLVDAKAGVNGASKNTIGSQNRTDIQNPHNTQNTRTIQRANAAYGLKIRLVYLQDLLFDLMDLLDEEKLLGVGGRSMERLRVSHLPSS